MILSSVELQKAQDDGRLKIDPEPLPRKPPLAGDAICPYNSHSVDLRLDNIIKVPEGGTFVYDLTQPGELAELISKHSKHYNLTLEQPFHLKPGTFILARTLERIELPTNLGSPFLAARIEGKSSRARCGVLIHFTASTVHPGWAGQLTLEMINLGPATFVLVPGMPIAQLIVEEVKGELIFNPSQFQNQITPEGLRAPMVAKV